MDDIKLVKGYEAVAKEVGPINHLTFQIIRELTLFRFKDIHDDSERRGVRMILEGRTSSGVRAVAFQSDDIGGFKYDGTMASISGLELNYTPPGTGRPAWTVSDYENGVIKFVAESASMQLLPEDHVKRWYLGWPGCMDSE